MTEFILRISMVHIILVFIFMSNLNLSVEIIGTFYLPSVFIFIALENKLYNLYQVAKGLDLNSRNIIFIY